MANFKNDENDALLEYFGMSGSPQFVVGEPVPIRFNCKVGKVGIDRNPPHLAEIEFSLIAPPRRFFGFFGEPNNSADPNKRTKYHEWLQLFFAAAPGCDGLPQNVVLVAYLKTFGKSAFSLLYQELLAQGIAPPRAVIKAGFTPAKNAAGDDFMAPVFSWRLREGAAEQDQLRLIATALRDRPEFHDVRGTQFMVPIDGLPAGILEQLQFIAEQRRALQTVCHPAEIIHALAEGPSIEGAATVPALAQSAE